VRSCLRDRPLRIDEAMVRSRRGARETSSLRRAWHPNVVGYHRRVIYVAALVGLVFGAGDQYLGSLKPMVALGPWTVSVSQMSALWLLLPFACGWTQERPRRAMLAGLVATVSGLIGYLAMMLGPAEGLAASRIPAAALAWTGANLLVIAGGSVTGPAFGLLGQRWRVNRSRIAAVLVAGAFVFEPLARRLGGHLFGPRWVWGLEAALGVGLIATFFLVAGRRRAAPAIVTG
jgi:hypothetical protein